MVLQCEEGRGEESQAAVVEEDDNGEGSGVCVHVRGNEEAKPDQQLMVSSVRVFHGRTKELEFDGLFLCVWVRVTKLKKK